MFNRSRSGIALGAAILSIPGLSLTPQAGYTQQIEEIVVSVRRRDENLQEVPLSVSTIGEEELERFGINNTADVVQYTAGLEFDEGFGAQDTRIVIRGLSPTRGRQAEQSAAQQATAWQPWRGYAVIRAWAGCHRAASHNPSESQAT